MKKFIYINYEPLTIRHEKNCYIEKLLEQGIPVEYWDLTPIFFKDLLLADTIERPFVKKFKTCQEFEAQLKKEDLHTTVFNVIIVYELRSMKLYRILTRHKCTLHYYCRGRIPMPPAPDMTLSQKIMSKLSLFLKPKALVLYVADRIWEKIRYGIPEIYKKLRLVKEYDVVFTAGGLAEKDFQGHSSIVHINYFDHDNYLEKKGHEERLIEGDYCVFLDTYTPYHPDLKMFGHSTVEPEPYFKALNSFFDNIEKTFKSKVVIAGHPVSNYDPSAFNGRTIIKYKANELVAHCRFALAHPSTSISYAVLHKKPLVFFYTEAMRIVSNGHFVAMTDYFAELLNAPRYILDQLTDFRSFQVPAPDLKRYEDYKYTYLTSKESERTPTREIVVAYLLNMFKRS